MLRSIIFFIFFITISLAISQETNCKLQVVLENKQGYKFSYINRESVFYYIDTIGKNADSLCLLIREPLQANFLINNDAENVIQFYIHEGNYTIKIDVANKKASFINSPLNDEYKEMMRIHDSMFKKYKIMHAMLYPYNGMDRDSAHDWIRKYLPLCDSLSDIHVNNFYETHLSSYLTLEYIFTILQYTFENPGYDTIIYDVKRLKILFNNLNPNLKKYKIYNECEEMFNKDRIKPPDIAKPLWNNKN